MGIVDDHAFSKVCITGILDATAREHLFYDELDVLARNRLTLEFVNLSDFSDDVFLCTIFPAKFEYFFDIRRTISEQIALLDTITNLNKDGTTICKGIFDLCGLFLAHILDLRKYLDEFLLAHFLDVSDDTVNGSDNSWILWTTLFEDFFDAWQTGSDVSTS